jgi:putative addiction module killer protein
MTPLREADICNALLGHYVRYTNIGIMPDIRKEIRFAGSSLKDLQRFPSNAFEIAAAELDRLQEGYTPSDIKRIHTVGDGVYEIRIHTGQAFRIFYVVKYHDAIWVLHAFEKKSQQTAQEDIKLGQRRYKQVAQEYKQRTTEEKRAKRRSGGR